MENLTKALYSKMTTVGTLKSLVRGRFYEDYAEQGSDYPHIVYSIVSSPKDKTFTEEYRNTMVQFSIYSDSRSSGEIKSIYAALSAMFDECSLSVTGSTVLWMREENMIPNISEIASKSGTKIIREYHVDYEIRTSLN